MGDLVKTPMSEVIATLEVLGCWGVGPEHLTKFRKASSYVQRKIAEAMISCDEKIFARSLDLFGGAAATIAQHVVDCDAKPFVPNGWKVAGHRKGDRQFVLDLSKVRLHLSPNQVDGKYIEGNKLRKELASEPVLNANVLDYLLAHPELIPDDWKGKYVFFWGTIYRLSNGSLYVRYLYFRGGAWDWGRDWLGNGWCGDGPAVVLAS